MGWAEKLPSGKYRGVYRDARGQKRSAGTFSHKARAERAASAKEEDARKSMAADPEAYKRPWGDWCADWWETRTVNASTLRNDTYRRYNHLAPAWDHVAIGAITRHDVKAWAARLSRSGLGPESVRRAVHLLSASLVAAVDAEIIEANPASRIKLPGGPPAPERYLTGEEYDTLRSHLATETDQLITDLLVHTGVRWGEMAGLHCSRVNLERGYLRVVETFDEPSNAMNAYPKGKRLREVPLTDDLVTALGERIKKRGDCATEHNSGRCPSPLLLTTDAGRPLRNSNWAYRVWSPAVEFAEIGHVRPHDLRHTAASWALQNGATLAEVGQLLGHVSPQTTQRYAHLAAPDHSRMRAALTAPRLPHSRVAEKA